MNRSSRRLWAVIAGALLCAALVALALSGVAAANEGPPIVLPVVARGYYYVAGPGSYLHFLDGTVTNDSSVTVRVDRVQVSWAESSAVVTDVWVGCDKLAPGQWTTFHTSWPDDVNAAWTPVTPTASAYQVASSSLPIALTVEGTATAPAEDGMRIYMAKVRNDSGVTVSSIEVVGREMDGGGTFVDSLFSWDLPDSLAPGASAYIKVRGKAYGPSPSVQAEMRFTALEKPVITLTPDTLTPAYGTPITFRIDLKRSNGAAATGWRTLKIYHSFDGQNWEDEYFHQETETGSVVTTITPDRPTYYRAVYWGGDDLGQVMSEWMLATPRVANGAPATPSSVHVSRAFAVSGRLNAGFKPSGSVVTIYAEKKIGRRWVRKIKVTTAVDATGAYRKSLKLKSRGTWRVRAYRAGVGYSKYRTVRVVR